MRIILFCLALTLIAACHPHPLSSHNQRGSVAVEGGDRHSTAAKHSIPLDQLEPDFLFMAAQSAIGGGKLATAAAYLKVVVNKDPYAILPRAQLAEALLKSGQAAESLPHFAALLDGESAVAGSLDGKERLRLRLLQIAAQISTGRVDDAERALNRVLQQHPAQLAARLQLTELYLAQNRADEALTLIDQGVARHDSPRLRQLQVQILLKEGRLQDALKSLQAMQDLAPDSAEITILFSKFALQMGRTTLAEQRLRDFLRHHPDNLDVTRTLGALL
ncbi:MAG: tetratricopeptide repeat protein, partial [Mariprofundales bacterium]|nr:tetratricopeptide repeat protein [Mariprofundales bacterium]